MSYVGKKLSESESPFVLEFRAGVGCISRGFKERTIFDSSWINWTVLFLLHPVGTVARSLDNEYILENKQSQ
jgi:hypothetical protein